MVLVFMRQRVDSYEFYLKSHWLKLSTCFIHSWKRNCAKLLLPWMSATVDHSVQHKRLRVHFSCWHVTSYLICHATLSEPIQWQCKSLTDTWWCIFRLTWASLPEACLQGQDASLEWTSSHQVAVLHSSDESSKGNLQLVSKLAECVRADQQQICYLSQTTRHQHPLCLTPSTCEVFLIRRQMKVPDNSI